MRFPNPNKFNRLVSIERRNAVQEESYGSPQVVGWDELAKVYASIATVDGREYVVPGLNQNVPLATHRITFRWPGFRVKPKDRIGYEGRSFNITRVDNVEEANRFIQVLATELPV
ncbi:phage head closure protein [Paludisphaera borealis]|uniref:Phage head-tail adapter protein n=1 Tax=Paludisphaera borealis TaxID=1387353 RepID=A0A1U7CX72_9BACT|nr:phage head closure protein [Paludisphaera borealis]APW63535.1 hypothetical protein BSF38_05107 [Paludisphaera borealis]